MCRISEVKSRLKTVFEAFGIGTRSPAESFLERVRITDKDDIKIKPIPEYNNCWIERLLIMNPSEGKRVHMMSRNLGSLKI